MLQKIRGESGNSGTKKCRETGAGEFPRGHRVKGGWYLEIPNNMESTAREQITKGLRSSVIRLSVDDVAHEFGLTERRLDIPIRCYAWEGWRASAAIGYFFGKKIFCFPWFDSYMLMEVITHTAYLFFVEKLKRNGAIVLLPSDNRKVLEEVTDEIIELDNPRFRDLSCFNEYMREYGEKKLLWQKNE